MHKIFIFFSLFSLSISAQVNTQLLPGNWTKIRTRMLDGSRDLSESYVSTKFFEWQLTPTKFCMDLDTVHLKPISCFDYKLEGHFIRTSPQAGYQIEKLTADSLIVTERLSGETAPDKIKKLWFVRTSKLRKAIIERTKFDTVITASENFTPLQNKNMIVEINQRLLNMNKNINLDMIGNLVFYPKKQKIEFEIKNINEVARYQKPIEAVRSVIENSYANWNMKDFEHFDKVYLPVIFNTRHQSIDKEWTLKGTEEYYYTNDIADIPKIRGISADKVREATENFRNGFNAFQDKKYNKAIAYYQKSYELDDRNADALYNLAAIYSLLKDSTNACKTLKILSDLEQTEGRNLFNQNCTR